MLLRLALTVLLVAGPAILAKGHDAPSGWSYPPGCCNGTDCQPEPISLVPGGYLLSTGEIISPRDYRVKPSGDSETHRCGTSATTHCIYIPAGV